MMFSAKFFYFILVNFETKQQKEIRINYIRLMQPSMQRYQKFKIPKVLVFKKSFYFSVLNPLSPAVVASSCHNCVFHDSSIYFSPELRKLPGSLAGRRRKANVLNSIVT